MNLKTVLATLFIMVAIISCSKDSSKVGNAAGITFSNTSVSNVTTSKALASSQVTLTGSLQVQEQGFVLSTAQNPTVSDLKKKSDSLKTGVYVLQINNLEPGTTYYAKPYVITTDGTIYYGEAVTFNIKPIALEANFGGGIIVWLDPTGKHGIVAAQQGLNFASEWGCTGIDVPGTKTEIGSGQENTRLILQTCSNTTKAAKFCDTLHHNGFSDWYLPSKDELALLYAHRKAIGFNTVERWSSSQSDVNIAWAQSFDSTAGAPVARDKSSVLGVRPVRSF